MQNKRLYILLGIVILLIGAAAFLAGRMFSRGIGFGNSSGTVGNGQVFISLDDITPAPELPTITSEITGIFVERKDNTVMVQLVSFDAGVGGMAGDSPSSGPIVEVVVSGNTTIYRETTEFSRPVPGEDFSVQQTVEESTLDDIGPQTMITVWGRRSGDRVIADVLFYSNPLMLKKP
jgi:hypothetical protein